MNPYKIMLVDDEEEVRTSIIRKIDWQDAGFEVIGDAENGKEALEKIEQNEPDVVLTDIRMPYMDGLEMAENIRQRYPSIKIVIFLVLMNLSTQKGDQAQCDRIYFKAGQCRRADGDFKENQEKSR